jgi:hypothetical protein
MKRVITLVVLLSAMTVAMQAQSVKVGIKGGLDIVNMSFDEDVFKTDNKMGWFVGPTVKVSLPITGLGFDIAALYDVKKYDLTLKQKTETVSQRSVLIPVNARFNFGIGGSAGIYVAAGPQFAFNIGDDYKDIFKDDALQESFQLKKSSFSVNLGAGVYLSKHFELGFAYNIALGSTADASWKSSTDAVLHKDDSKPKSWQISAAYYF